MKYHRIFALFFTVVLLCGLFSGCSTTKKQPSCQGEVSLESGDLRIGYDLAQDDADPSRIEINFVYAWRTGLYHINYMDIFNEISYRSYEHIGEIWRGNHAETAYNKFAVSVGGVICPVEQIVLDGDETACVGYAALPDGISFADASLIVVKVSDRDSLPDDPPIVTVGSIEAPYIGEVHVDQQVLTTTVIVHASMFFEEGALTGEFDYNRKAYVFTETSSGRQFTLYLLINGKRSDVPENGATVFADSIAFRFILQDKLLVGGTVEIACEEIK